MKKKNEHLNEHSFKLLTPSELNDVFEIARRNLTWETKPLNLTPQQFLTQCWVEGVLTVLINKQVISLKD